MIDVARHQVSGRSVSTRGIVWFAFATGALLLLAIDDLVMWSWVVVAVALTLAAVPSLRPSVATRVDRRDLLAIAVSYVCVVGAFRLAFTVFTTDNVTGLFLSFAFGLLAGVVGPIVYQVWVRGRDLRSLGIGTHNLKSTIAVALPLAAIQFLMTLWGTELPAWEDWLPLLVMSLVVGLFEAVFFRGFVQTLLESAAGPAAGVAGAAVLYSLYHVGYGMGGSELWFLFGLGIVYAVIYRLTTNILVLWPLLTPLGAFFNNLQAGDIELPWESILGFADVALVMAGVMWFAHRHIRREEERSPTSLEKEVPV